jgi:thiamine biosynthesis lipoprotein
MPPFASAVIALAVLRLADPGPGPGDPTRFEFTQIHMGSEFKLILYSTDEPTARRASDAAFTRIAALDSALSDYNPASELNRLCDAAGGPPVAVSDDLFAVLDRSLALSRESGGAFDVTIKPVVRLWRRAFRQKELPDPRELAEARALVGYQMLHLDPAARTARLERPGMRLDLGGIAKGYASDAAQAVLREHGITAALVAAAGDIVVSDPPPGEPGWRVGIAPLESSESSPTELLLLSHAAISTSGDAERFAVIGGVRYAHIVDPHTGVGLIDRASVSVVAKDGTTADSLATTVFVLGPEQGLPLVEARAEAAALFVRLEGERPGNHPSHRWKDLPRAPVLP